MKLSYRIILLTAVCLCAAWQGRAQGTDIHEVWDSANTAYVNAEYDRAVSLYDSIAKSGFSSEKLYYNLGNAYFKQNMTGRALLNYYRAQRLDPADPDINYNIRVANTYVKDKIEAVPEFFLKGWVRAISRSASSDTWAVVSLAMLAVSLGAVLFYLLSRRLALRKAGFYTAIVALALGIFAVSFSAAQKRAITHSAEAVVMITAAPVKSSPENNGKEIFILHEGTKVRIEQVLNGWREISIADGNKGWIDEKSIEVI